MSTDERRRRSDRELVQLRHDLRQYVAAGILLTELTNGDSGAREARERLQRLHSVFVRMDELTDPSPPAVVGRTLDLVVLVEECVSLARISHDVALEVTYPGPIEAVGDPVLLARAVLNVLDNAIRAAGPTGHVHVQVCRPGAEAVVEVTDDGAGFGQIPSVSGHGMSIVDRAVRVCRGRLEIASGPGPGTRVRLLIPAQSRAGDVA